MASLRSRQEGGFFLPFGKHSLSEGLMLVHCSRAILQINNKGAFGLRLSKRLERGRLLTRLAFIIYLDSVSASKIRSDIYPAVLILSKLSKR